MFIEVGYDDTLGVAAISPKFRRAYPSELYSREQKAR
jgi:hypothetical protein